MNGRVSRGPPGAPPNRAPSTLTRPARNLRVYERTCRAQHDLYGIDLCDATRESRHQQGYAPGRQPQVGTGSRIPAARRPEGRV